MSCLARSVLWLRFLYIYTSVTDGMKWDFGLKLNRRKTVSMVFTFLRFIWGPRCPRFVLITAVVGRGVRTF